MSHRSRRWPGQVVRELHRRWPQMVLVGIVLSFGALWGTVIIGHDVLVGTDLLRTLAPWRAGGSLPTPRNPLVSDPVTQFLPWLVGVRSQLLSGHLPLWNPYAFAGAPLLANDQSAALSPFTLISLPFPAAWGYSLAMLAKLIVAGVGMTVYLRQMRFSATAGMLAGLVYASSSFMIDWLGHPHTAVAAIFPWAFAAVEMWLRERSRRAFLLLAAAIALQFLAGHAETTLHMGLLLSFYALVRSWQQPRRWLALGGLMLAGVLGTALAAIQLIPFLVELRSATLVADRSAAGAGLGHLSLTAAASWLVPNGRGNPAIDMAGGRAPNYLESTGSVGVAALLLAVFGLTHVWRTRRTLALALGIPVLTAGGTVYGVLTPIVGRLPLLSTSNNARMIVVICFCLSTLAGIGFEAVLTSKPRPRKGRYDASRLIWLGWAAVAAIIGLAALLLVKGGQVDALLPSVHGTIGFWLAFCLVALIAATALVSSARAGRRVAGAFGLAVLMVMEATVFAGPFQPKVSASTALPTSPAVAWLQAHSGEAAVAGEGTDLIANTAALYNLRDVRGYDVTIDPRVRLYWQHADAGYQDGNDSTQLSRPGSAWLAAAGVRYYVSSASGVPAGALVVFHEQSFVISQIAGTRARAYAATSVTTAPDSAAAVAKLAANPAGPVVIEAETAAPNAAARVAVTRDEPGVMDLEVSASAAATIVILQSYSPDWFATVDGSTTPVRPANILFQSLQVAGGHHQVTLRYRPVSVVSGAVVSGAAVLMAVLIMLGPAVLRRRR